MKWKKFTIHTTTAAEDYLSSLLDDLGIEGVEIEDNVPLTEDETKGMFIDLGPDLPPDDGTAEVSFYLDEEQDADELIKKVKSEIEALSPAVDFGACTIEESETEDEDWVNNWKEFFHPFSVGDLLIKPTWEDVPEEDEEKMVIQIDPGTAFGTGQHETTKLCIEALQKYISPHDQVLDVGTGSGILAICALKLGAASACGTDLDDNAIRAACENREVNEIEEDEFSVIRGDLISDPDVADQVGYERYDLAVANILADVILLLQEKIPAHLKPGGLFVASGILEERLPEVLNAIEKNKAFELVEVTSMNDWAAVVACRVA